MHSGTALRTLALPLLTLAHSSTALGQGETALLSETRAGWAGNLDSYSASISRDGRRVCFWSHANDLLAGDTNNFPDVFLRDLDTGGLALVSVDPNGVLADGPSLFASISGDGRYVAFESSATNLVPGGTNGIQHIHLKDLQTGAASLMSLDTAGVPAELSSWNPSISNTGRFVVFTSNSALLVAGDTNGLTDVFLRDTLTATTTRESLGGQGAQANSISLDPSVSDDGRFVAFLSYATNLVPGDTNGFGDVFVRDRRSATTQRVSVGQGGVQANNTSDEPRICGNGRFVAFTSTAHNLVPGDLNDTIDAFVFDLASDATERISVATDGTPTDYSSYGPSITSDGRFVVFATGATTLVAGDTNFAIDVYLRDRHTGTTVRASFGDAGQEPDGNVYAPVVSEDGRITAFQSIATNLVANDRNLAWDVFAYQRCSGVPTTYCTAKVDSLGCTPAIHSQGTPSASSAAGFRIQADQVLNHAPGLLLYGLGPGAVPFQRGYLCEAPPLRRTPGMDSGGNSQPADCSGLFSLDFNAMIQTGFDPDLIAGTAVYCQFWYRDPYAARGTGMTAGLAFQIQP